MSIRGRKRFTDRVLRRADSDSLICITLSIGLFVGFTVDADQAGQPYRWGESTVDVKIVSGSNEIDDGSDIRAIRQALTTWSTIDCSAFAMNEVTTLAEVEIDFLSSGWPGALEGALGVASRVRDANAVYTSGSIEFNDQEFPFGAAGEPNVYDIESVAVHELGHMLGLEHTPRPDATMNFRGGRGYTFFRNLSEDDVAGACYLYPKTSFACTKDAQCPVLILNRGGSMVNLFCDGIECVPDSSKSYSYGHACYDADDCDGASCIFNPDVLDAPLATVPNPGFCTAPCDVVACPTGSFCSDVMGLGQPVCFAGADDCIEDADCLDTMGPNTVCSRGLDGVFRCETFCVDEDDCLAFANASCVGSVPGDTLGRCREPGNQAQGVECSDALDCQSLVCGGGTPSYCCEGSNCGPVVSPNDGGPTQDGRHNDGHVLDGDSHSPGEPSPGNDLHQGALVGGCSAATPSIAALIGILFMLRQPRRYPTGGRTI